MTFKDGLDRSNEETKSSWSSSEEALAACEGLIFNEPLNGGTKCRYHITLMPCPFTGPKMFWGGPNFLCQTKNMICIQ